MLAVFPGVSGVAAAKKRVDPVYTLPVAAVDSCALIDVGLAIFALPPRVAIAAVSINFINAFAVVGACLDFGDAALVCIRLAVGALKPWRAVAPVSVDQISTGASA